MCLRIWKFFFSSGVSKGAISRLPSSEWRTMEVLNQNAVVKPAGKKLSQQSDAPNNTRRHKLSCRSRVFTATSMSLQRRCATPLHRSTLSLRKLYHTDLQGPPTPVPSPRSRQSAKPFPCEPFVATPGIEATSFAAEFDERVLRV